ncbi:murein L,D-transpeptidase catalytic domain family protein [Flavobacterium sp. SM15]|uniref:murein L,D-transpeptidase catalytic domain family protein n=1 Tax=Flavobacterium sp. SM15 TaxID=2908005 RepID=UPI001EDB2C57|nr:murein L,D-transpeptidase catalytic domain family protein [Flavobacterium sp. SM15]MCG2610739.1 murein L,D-transpeptidase catalytic domain family protein [Flavobacterium sp. SM15]
MIYRVLPILFVFFLSFKPTTATENHDPKLLAANAKASLELKVKSLYASLDVKAFSMPKFECFSKALEGFYQLKEQGIIKKDLLTIVDFSLSSTQKRLWVIDMATNSILLQSVVSHGRNSGEEYATSFSNETNSNKSSLGFYATGETYNGKHGLSLKLDGLEYGINDNARNRAVVMHGADYAAESIIRQQGRLGRSQGCPAVPFAIHKELINMVKDKSCLFIYHPSRTYENKSKLVS